MPAPPPNHRKLFPASGSELDAPLAVTHSAQEGAHGHARKSRYARSGIYPHGEARNPAGID